MTGFILRELGAGLLVAIGLLAFRQAWVWLKGTRISRGVGHDAVGFIAFRGGIHLLKVAVPPALALRPQPRDGSWPLLRPNEAPDGSVNVHAQAAVAACALTFSRDQRLLWSQSGQIHLAVGARCATRAATATFSK